MPFVLIVTLLFPSTQLLPEFPLRSGAVSQPRSLPRILHKFCLDGLVKFLTIFDTEGSDMPKNSAKSFCFNLLTSRNCFMPFMFPNFFEKIFAQLIASCTINVNFAYGMYG